MEPAYNPEYLFKNYDKSGQWFTENPIAKAVEHYLWEFSNLNAPQAVLKKIRQGWIDYYQDLFTQTPGLNVFIMGTGCGVLPLLAARAGKKVYACDPYPVLAKLSREIIDRNAGGLQERIVFFFKDVMEIKLGDDLPEKCDLFVFDVPGYALLETGIVPLMEHMRKQLLTPGAVVVPAGAEIYARCVEISIANSGFDLSPLSEYQWSVGSRPFDPAETKHRWLSEALQVCSLDFTQPVPACRQKVLFPITAQGNWNGIVYWHTMFGQPVYSIQYLDQMPVRPGETEEITLYQLRTKISFEPRRGVEKIHTSCLQPWHVDMVNDAVRSANYNAAITEALAGKGSCRVLDIGSGSGLLSMMAARANPQSRITGCEVLEALSETAAQIVRLNNCQEQVSILHTDIRSLELEEKADFVIHEVLASGMLGEGVLHFLAYTKEHLAKPGASYIPRAARVKGMLVEHWLGSVLGIDVSAVNAYRWHPDYASIDLSRADCRALSAPFDVFDFDFTEPGLEPQSREILVRTTAAGTANAVVYWFELIFNDTVFLSTGPFESATCWHQAIQYIQGITAGPGAEIPLKLGHDCYKIHFEAQVDRLTKGSTVSAVPQFDALWANRLRSLEKQYNRIAAWASDGDENSRELVEAVVRIASDPGSFCITPAFASRFAESFFIR